MLLSTAESKKFAAGAAALCPQVVSLSRAINRRGGNTEPAKAQAGAGVGISPRPGAGCSARTNPRPGARRAGRFQLSQI
jgi:hypothetical protein